MSRFVNKTRTSQSIPRKLLKEGKAYLIPLYYLMLTSRLANEAIHNSGSYHFADHIYGNKPRGKYIVGHLLDTLLLKLPSAKSFRYRYLYSKKEIYNVIEQAGIVDELRILAVPSGLARELFEVADELENANHPIYHKLHFHGIDLDHDLISTLAEKASKLKHSMHFHHGNALDHESYKHSYDMIISLGFSEFVSDDELISFYKIAHEKLKPKGVFVTSGMLPHTVSDYLMRNLAELHTHYRSQSMLEKLAHQAGLQNFRTYQDPHKLQTMLVSVKE